jgi:hypothetical protein
MVGEGGEVVIKGDGVDRLDGFAHVPMQGHPATGGDPVVERVPHQGVGEAITGGLGHLKDQPSMDGLFESRENVVFREALGLLENRQFELGSDDGS